MRFDSAGHPCLLHVAPQVELEGPNAFAERGTTLAALFAVLRACVRIQERRLLLGLLQMGHFYLVLPAPVRVPGVLAQKRCGVFGAASHCALEAAT